MHTTPIKHRYLYIPSTCFAFTLAPEVVGLLAWHDLMLVLRTGTVLCGTGCAGWAPVLVLSCCFTLLIIWAISRCWSLSSLVLSSSRSCMRSSSFTCCSVSDEILFSWLDAVL